MKALLKLIVVSFIFVMLTGGYYYHLNEVERAKPRKLFSCETHNLNGNVQLFNCKRINYRF